jgi:hypothetical protein
VRRRSDVGVYAALCDVKVIQAANENDLRKLSFVPFDSARFSLLCTTRSEIE